MSSYQSKISRTANAPLTPPDETEQTVAQAILDLENNVPELKSELRVLQISAAREVDVKGGKKAIIIFVPVPQLKAFHKIQQRFVLAGTSGRASTPGGGRLGGRGCKRRWAAGHGRMAAGSRLGETRGTTAAIASWRGLAAGRLVWPGRTRHPEPSRAPTPPRCRPLDSAWSAASSPLSHGSEGRAADPLSWPAARTLPPSSRTVAGGRLWATSCRGDERWRRDWDSRRHHAARSGR